MYTNSACNVVSHSSRSAPRFRRRRQLGCTQERLLVDMPQGFREKIRNVPSVYFVCVLSSREMRASTRESVDHLPVTLLGLARPEYWRAKRFTSEASFILIRADLVRYAPCGINMVKVQWNAQPGIYASDTKRRKKEMRKERVPDLD